MPHIFIFWCSLGFKWQLLWIYCRGNKQKIKVSKIRKEELYPPWNKRKQNTPQNWVSSFVFGQIPQRCKAVQIIMIKGKKVFKTWIPHKTTGEKNNPSPIKTTTIINLQKTRKKEVAFYNKKLNENLKLSSKFYNLLP